MDYLHLSETADGVSFFSDVSVEMAEGDFAPPAPQMLVSATRDAARCLFLELPPGWGGARRPSPRRQFAFCLGGRMKVTAGTGEVREVGPGGIWLMEDVAGSGHRSEVLGDAPVRLAIVQLD